MWSYDAFGAQRQVYYGHVVGTPFGFAGQFSDGATGLQYLRARYYDPETQQFLTVDPALAWTEQAYAYVEGNSTNRLDPSGLWSVGLCRGGNAEILFGLTLTECLVITSAGELGKQYSIAPMASTNASAAAQGGLQWSPGAEKLSDLENWSIGGGFAGGPWIFGGGFDWFASETPEGQNLSICSLTGQVGPSLSPVEVHGGGSFTWIDWSINLPQVLSGIQSWWELNNPVAQLEQMRRRNGW